MSTIIRTHQYVLDVIAACTREVLPALGNHDLTRSDRLTDLGANSLDRAEIVVRVLEILNLDVLRSTLVKVANVGELVDVLHGHLQSR